MALDLIKDFGKYEKQISTYVRDRVFNTYFSSKCCSALKQKINKMTACWDMRPGSTAMTQGQRFLAEIYYPLVKEQQLIMRAIATNATRSDPFYSVIAIGNTPDENASNAQDLLQSNNRGIKFRQRVSIPAIDLMAKFGSCVILNEYVENKNKGWKTSFDPMVGARREYGVYSKAKNAECYIIRPEHYFQDPHVLDPADSTYRGHIERLPLSKLIATIGESPEMFIKENVDKLLPKLKKGSHIEQAYIDPQGRQAGADYSRKSIDDVVKGQFQIHIDGNEDDEIYYTVWMVGETIIRFQDNPYDENLNQYTVMTFEPRLDYWHGNTRAEYSVGNENALNLINGIGLENLLASLNRYIFADKNVFDGVNIQNKPLNFINPVNVPAGYNLSNLMFTYQVPDNSGNSNEALYQRIMYNNNRLAAKPDLSSPTGQGNMSNQTATAANIMTNKGDISDADVLEQASNRFADVGYKQLVILQQFLGNEGPIMLKPKSNQQQRILQKDAILGNYEVKTCIEKTYYGQIQNYQNTISWLVNLAGAGRPELQDMNIRPLVQQVLKIGEMLKVDQVLPETQEMQPGYQQSQVMPGQEMAGAAQEMQPGQGNPATAGVNPAMLRMAGAGV